MKSLLTPKRPSTSLALFLGIGAGFVFLLSFFAGLGTPADSLLVIGVFFGVIAGSLTLLLRPAK